MYLTHFLIITVITKPMGGGSINKLTLLLQEKSVTYDTSTIDEFRIWDLY